MTLMTRESRYNAVWERPALPVVWLPRIFWASALATIAIVLGVPAPDYLVRPTLITAALSAVIACLPELERMAAFRNAPTEAGLADLPAASALKALHALKDIPKKKSGLFFSDDDCGQEAASAAVRKLEKELPP